MKLFRNILSQLHTFILWVLLSALLWGWIFSFLTDTDQKHKVILYIDAYELHERDLAIRLEKEKPDGIKMIKVRNFDYDLVETGEFEKSDIYIVSETKLRETLRDDPDSIAVIQAPADVIGYTVEGRTYGLKVYDAEKHSGPGVGQFLRYWPDQYTEQEDCYLCVNAASIHLKTNPGAVDNAAWETVMVFLSLGQ